MKIDDLVLLIKAGYTKANIEQLGISMGLDEVHVEAPAEAPVEAPVEQKEVEDKTAPVDDRMTKLENKLDYVINRFNYMSVQQSAQPETKVETVDDILASMIK